MTLRADVHAFLTAYGVRAWKIETDNTQFEVYLAGAWRLAWIGFDDEPFVGFGFVLDEFTEDDSSWFSSISNSLDAIGAMVFHGEIAQYSFVQHVAVSCVESDLRDIFHRAEKDVHEILNCFAAGQELILNRTHQTLM